MCRAAFLPWPIAIVTVRSRGTMSPPAKMPGMAGHHVGADHDGAVLLELDARRPAQERDVGVLAERQDTRVGLERLELPGRLRPAMLVELHHLDRERRAGDRP